jgi:peptide-methionine (R)-S-oxide reductase
MTRPAVLTTLAGFFGALAASVAPRPAPATDVAWHMSDEEWKKRLKPDVYQVLRKHATETAFTSPLNHEKRKGTFFCAGCALALFSSKAKFDSGTGWPSFYEPLKDAVATQSDYSILEPRTECHCKRCGGHLGHVFDDGPKPTGLRYCINGLALTFKPDDLSSRAERAERA